MMSTLVAFESSLRGKQRALWDGLFFLQKKRKETQQENDPTFFHKVYPHGVEIHSLLNPLYLNSVRDFASFARHDYILVRDGFYPLMDFFYRFGRPGNSEVILLVHEKLQFLVPEAWKNNILTYNIQRRFNYQEHRLAPKTLYLCALSCDSDIRLETFQQKLSEVQKLYGNDLNNIDVKIGLLLREEPYYQHRKERLHESFPLVREVYLRLGLESQFCIWPEIIAGKGFHQSCYYYMCEEYFSHAYSYIDHFFLSHRCMPFDDRFDQKEEGEIVFEMVPGYDIHINKFHFQPNVIWSKILEMANNLGLASTLFHLDFSHYCWELGEKYLLKRGRKETTDSFVSASMGTIEEEIRLQ